MQKIAKILTLVAIFGASSVYATENKLYVGLSFGSVDVDSKITKTAGSISLDDSDSGFKLYGGYKLSENVAIEGSYGDLGNFSLTGIQGETFTLDGEQLAFLADGTSVIDSTSLGVAGVFSLPVSHRLSPYVKLGLHRWEMQGNDHLRAFPGLGNESGTDMMYALGISLSFIDNLQLRGEYERIEVDSTYANHIDYASVGLSYSF